MTLTREAVTEAANAALDLIEIKYLARQLGNAEQFYAMLQTTKASLRKPVYEQIKPFLRFPVKPFCLLKFSSK